MEFPGDVLRNRVAGDGAVAGWSIDALYESLAERDLAGSKRSVERAVLTSGLLPPALDLETLRDDRGRPVKRFVAESLMERARRDRTLCWFVQFHLHAGRKAAAGGQ